MPNILLCRLTAMTLLTAVACTAQTPTTHGATTETFANRNLIVYVPSHLPQPGQRALVVVLHGGLGNAQRIESGQSEHPLNLDAVAEKYGFLVAYLNGTPATRMAAASNMLAWNAGGSCCGQAFANNVDDVTYIRSTVDHLTTEYHLNPTRIFAMGHSNGAMMAQRLACETPLFPAIIAISGPLNLDIAKCPSASGKRILALHGADDQNVPIAGGRGPKGLSGVAFQSEAHTKQVYTSSGATYTLQIVPNADHFANHIDAALQKQENQSISEKAAKFFGLTDKH